MILKAHKYRLYPNKAQKEYLSKCFGHSRFVYNFALAIKKDLWEKEKKNISIFDIAKQLVKLKKENDYIWLQEVSARSLGYALRNLDCAFKNFFREIKKGNKSAGYPKFKSKYDCSSFQTDKIKIDLKNQLVFLPKYKTGIPAILHREFKGKVKTSTISRAITGKYFVSVLVETNDVYPVPNIITKQNTIGIDLGIRSFAVITDGEKEIKRINHPHFLRTQKKRISRAQRKLSRKIKTSMGYKKQKHILGILHEKIKFRRNDFLDNQSFCLTKDKSYDTIAVEKLGITDLLQKSSKHLSYDIGDSGWLSFKSKLKYKSEREGKNFIECNRFDPTSKRCPNCDTINTLLKDEKEWVCPKCTFHVMDRDVKGANDVKMFALKKAGII